MKKFNKNQILEIIILITIIISIIVISIFAINVLNEKPEASKSNEIKNYSITRTIKYSKDPTSNNIYNLPLTEYINYYNSTYTIYIVSTDNIITNYIEHAQLSYNDIPEEQQYIMKNYCNKYDEIENKYKLQCTYKDSKLILKNNYSINLINDDILKTSDKDINIPIKKGTKLSDYITSLKEQNMEYTEVDKVD